MNTDYGGIIDASRSAQLTDVGAPELMAATVVNPAGEIHLVLIRHDALGESTTVYNANCPEAQHDQAGPLPLEFVRRVLISCRRTQPPGRA